MNIYLRIKKRFESQLAVTETRGRLKALINKESELDLHEMMSITFLGIDINPKYEGYVGEKGFSISPISRGYEPIVLFSIDGGLKENLQSTSINVVLAVTDIIQKLTLYLFIIVGVLSASLLIAQQPYDTTYFLFSFALGFYTVLTIVFIIRSYLTLKMLKKIFK